MTSESAYQEAYVWFWLPGETRPVVAGRLALVDDKLVFNYGRSYLARPNAIPVYEPELPLRPGALPLLDGLWMPNAIRDAAPDAWGRRVLINRKLGARGTQIDTTELTELTYLLKIRLGSRRRARFPGLGNRLRRARSGQRFARRTARRG